MTIYDMRISMLPNIILIQIWNNLVDLKEKISEFSRRLTSEVGFDCSCFSEAVQECHCVYSHLSFVSVELTSSVFPL